MPSKKVDKMDFISTQDWDKGELDNLWRLTKDIKLNWHTSLKVNEIGNGNFKLTVDEKKFSFVCLCNHQVKYQCLNGVNSEIKGCYSSYYGEKEPSNQLQFSINTKASIRYLSIISTEYVNELKWKDGEVNFKDVRLQLNALGGKKIIDKIEFQKNVGE